jgi:hypothetical protein
MPEKILWANVLQLALSDFFCVCFWDRTNAEIYQRDAISWFESSSRELGSFYFCCDILGLSASSIRKALSGDQAAVRKRLKSNPVPKKTPCLGLYDPAFECSAGRRLSEVLDHAG